MATFSKLTVQLSDGSLLTYLDSGAIPGSTNFSTIVILHGLCFNSYCFEDAFSLAPNQNLRLIAVQRKDYTGSSKYTEEEMNFLSNNPEKFLESIGKTWLLLLEYIITKTQVCPLSYEYRADTTKTSGGISLLGWSIGCVYATCAFKPSVALAEKKAYDIIEPYFSKLILYDPPHTGLGFTLTPPIIRGDGTTMYNPEWLDIPVETKLQKATQWLTSYFDNPASWNGLDLLDLDNSHGVSHDIRSRNGWNEEKLGKVSEGFPIRSELPLILAPVQHYVEKMTEDAVFNYDSNNRAFPNAKICYLNCRRSPWSFVWTAFTAKHKYQNLKNQFTGVRPIVFKESDIGNHFVHTDLPEEFLSTLRSFEDGE